MTFSDKTKVYTPTLGPDMITISSDYIGPAGTFEQKVTILPETTIPQSFHFP